jgi:hypothetical protein
MAFARGVSFGDEGKPIELIGSQRSTGDLGANHLHARLPLAVDAAAQTERPELIFGDLARQQLVGLFAEKLDVLTHDGVVLGFRMCMSAKGRFRHLGKYRFSMDYSRFRRLRQCQLARSAVDGSMREARRAGDNRRSGPRARERWAWPGRSADRWPSLRRAIR